MITEWDLISLASSILYMLTIIWPSLPLHALCALSKTSPFLYMQHRLHFSLYISPTDFSRHYSNTSSFKNFLKKSFSRDALFSVSSSEHFVCTSCFLPQSISLYLYILFYPGIVNRSISDSPCYSQDP